MTNNAKIITGVVVVGAATGFLIYQSRKNEAEGKELLDYLKTSVLDQTNATKAAADQIKNIDAIQSGTGPVKMDPAKIKIGNLSGNAKDPKIRDLLAKTNQELASSMKRIGTDQTAFFNALKNIKSKNTLAYIDKVFKVQYGEGLMKMMSGEQVFFNPSWCKYSEKTNTAMVALFPAFSNGCWTPWLAEWIFKLPEY